MINLGPVSGFSLFYASCCVCHTQYSVLGIHIELQSLPVRVYGVWGNNQARDQLTAILELPKTKVWESVPFFFSGKLLKVINC